MQNFRLDDIVVSATKAIADVVATELRKTKKDIREMAEKVSAVYPIKIHVGGKYFNEAELRANMNACYNVLRRHMRLPPETKLRYARFCKEAAELLKPKNEREIVYLCDSVIQTAEINTNTAEKVVENDPQASV